MRLKLLSFGITLLFCINAYSTEYQGSIFIDSNQNGKMDSGEKVLSGVAVSDGLNVVRSDSNGLFSLPGTARTRFIFITVPAGYKTTLKHYLKADEKSSSFDFGLQSFPTSAKKTTRFAQITDTETYIDNGWI